jgi:hypothetical protein
MRDHAVRASSRADVSTELAPGIAGESVTKLLKLS